jgi:hypothetical protein
MTLPENLTSLSRDELLALVAVLQRQVAALTAANDALRADIARLTRDGKRQAAPFSKGTRVAQPKRPGRKPGSGTFHYREAPLSEQITAPPVDVPVLVVACPACGGPLTPARVDFAYTTDILASPRPPVTQYRVSVCRCLICGKQVRGQPPDVAPDQYGATAHRVGDRAMAAAHALPYGIGMPVRKVPRVLAALPGIALPQGAITQDALRRATGEVGEAYACWRAALPASPVVHPDDTSWRVGGEAASLMAFDTDEATVYQSRPQHRHEEVQEVIPPDYEGGMVTDRGRSYEADAFDDVKQQKCVAHILRSISDVVAVKKGRARDFGERLKALMQDAVRLWHAFHAGEETDFPGEAQHLRDAVTHHLRPRILTDPDNQRLLNGIGRHHDRGNLLRFLEDPGIEPTNNRAERVLRPAVIARKVSQCSKNTPGAQAFAAFKSVVQTLAKQGTDSMVEGLYRLFRTSRTQSASP